MAAWMTGPLEWMPILQVIIGQRQFANLVELSMPIWEHTVIPMTKMFIGFFDCAANFFEDLPESVEIEQVDREYHRVITTGGQYCGFCYGTYHTEDATLERHHMETSIRPELAHQRFVEMDACTDCGYAKTSYTAAKTVVADYYGVADGAPHTVTVSDLSEAGVTLPSGTGIAPTPAP